MKLIESLFAGAGLFVAAVVGIVEKEEGVLVLGDDTLAGAIERIPFLLVEFYAPWCGHCKQLAPEYAKAAQELEDNEEVELAKVDATVHTKAASSYDVSGYPTIKFFKNGEASEYNGGRTAKDIVDWLNKKSGPSVVLLDDAAAAEAFKEKNEISLVLYTSENDESKIVTQFKKFADSTDDVACGIVSESAAAGALDITAENSVTLFKKFDEGRADYTEEKVTKTKLATFVKPHLLPYVVEFSDDVVQRLFGGDVREHLLFFRKDAKSEENVATVNAMREVAKAHQGELIFVAVDMDVSENARLAEFFGMDDSDYPAVRIINIKEQPKKFKAPEDFTLTEDGFEKFASDYLNGDLDAALNSEEVPDNWDAEDLKVVVGKNFEEIVLNEKTSTLLMAHAPWCGHCKSLMPVFEELADHFADDDLVVIGKMDATKNEVTHFSVSGFPTLKFFPAGGDMLDYEGGRTLDELIEYVDTHRGDDKKKAPKAKETADDEDEEALDDEMDEDDEDIEEDDRDEL